VREILSDLVAEQQFLDQFLQRISLKDWDRPTPAAGWTIRDTISHLADSEELTAGILNGTADLQRYRSTPDLDQLRQEAVEQGRKMRPQDVIEWWRGGRAKVVEPLSRMAADHRVDWIEGTMSARTLATTRLMEAWAHGLDIYATMDAEVEDSARIRHICWLGWKSLPYSFKIAGEDFAPIRVEVIGPGYAKWVYGPEDSADVIKGSASDWARLAVRRITPDKTRLKVTGDVASIAAKVVRAYL
jgi:uncharacterized protein (TIGR03084 family)